MQIRIILLVLLYLLFLPLPALGQQPPQISGETAVLMDAQTGVVLYGKEENKKMYPASTTKVLTALVALERARLTDMVTIGSDAAHAGGSAIWLAEGERLTLEELLYALLLNSANDAGVAIAQHIAGSVEKFAEISNDRARELGAKNTHFTNPHGMPDENHYTTAYDLALIGRKAMENKDFRKIVATVNHEIPRADPEAQRYLFNHNKLLWSSVYGYQGATGLKTGYTVEAGQCIVASAERDGRELIAVVLHAEGSNLWTDAIALLNYGFANFENQQILDSKKILTSLPVQYGKGKVNLAPAGDYFYTFSVGEKDKLDIKLEPAAEVDAPVAKGQVLGNVILSLDGKTIERMELIAAQDVEKDWFAWGKSVAYWSIPPFLILLWVRRKIRLRRARRKRALRRKRYYSDLME